MELLNTGYQRASKTATIAVEGSFLAYSSWRINIQGDDQGTRNFRSFNTVDGEAYDEGLIGFLTASMDYGGDWDANANPLDTLSFPGLYVRADLVDLEMSTCFLDQPSISPYIFPYSRVLTAAVGATVQSNTNVSFAATGRNQGPFFWPEGSV